MKKLRILCPGCGYSYPFDEDSCPKCGSTHITGEFERLLQEFDGGGFQILDMSDLHPLEAQ